MFYDKSIPTITCCIVKVCVDFICFVILSKLAVKSMYIKANELKTVLTTLFLRKIV